MGSPSLILALLGLSSVSYYLGWRRSISLAQGAVRNLHSLPGYHGLYTALWAAVPALLLLTIGVGLKGPIVTRIVVADLPQEIQSLPPERLNLVINDIRNLASGNIASQRSPAMLAAADRYTRLQGYGASPSPSPCWRWLRSAAPWHGAPSTPASARGTRWNASSWAF